MKNIFVLIVVCLFTSGVYAQTLAPTVISTTGGFASNANGSLSYTVGEMTMVETFSANGNILTQGFQQPNDRVVGLLDITQDEFGSFVIYPNPAVNNLWFGFQFPERGKVAVAVYNVAGQKIADVYNDVYVTGKTVQGYDVSNLAGGAYYMSLTFTGDDTGREHVTTKNFQVIN